MKLTGTVAALAATALAGSPVQKRQSSTVKGNSPIVTTKGNAFFAGQDRFYIRGVAYQPGGSSDLADPIANTKTLERDIKNFKTLGINTIRVYSVDNSQEHDEGMKMLDDAGIYLALDANTPKYSLNRMNEKALHQSYNEKYLQSVFATVDKFSRYSNTLLFFSGNEVINAPNNTDTAPYIRAVTRDMKNYIANRGLRPVPVGYSSADVAKNIEEQLKYFDCGGKDAENSKVDFFAFNDYSWCDPSSFQESGWDQKVKTYSGYDIPIFLSEFGCITNKREWEEIKPLYDQRMTPVYSGGLAYEYTLEDNGYGLVSLNNGNVEPNEDFKRLAQAYKNNPAPKGDGGYSEDGKSPDCPAQSDQWEVKDNLIPAPPSGIKQYMDKGAGDGPGIGKSVSGSQGGGDSYSQDEIQMSGEQPSGSPAGVDGDGNSSGSGDKDGAAAGLVAPKVGVAMVVFAASAIFAFIA